MPVELAGVRLYDLKEISKKIKLNPVTLRGYIEQRRLEAIKIGRSFRVTEDALRAFLLKYKARPRKRLSPQNDPFLKVIGIGSDGKLTKDIDKALYGDYYK